MKLDKKVGAEGGRGGARAVVVGNGEAAPTMAAGLLLKEVPPCGRDVQERLEEPSGVVGGSEVRKGAAEACKVVAERCVVCGIQRVEPSTVREEPAACVPGAPYFVINKRKIIAAQV